MQTKSACKFFKWLDKPTCARGVEVLKQIMKKVNDLKDENGTLVTRTKDLENEMEIAWKGLSNWRQQMINTWKLSNV
jgi:ABC-type histidine transport system ATPase subunit